MSPTAVMLLVACLIAIEAVVFFLVVRIVARTLDAFRRFPRIEPGPGAVRRSFQSISVGIVNLGFMVHLAIDATHLHVSPAALARLFRIRPSSVPLDAVQISKPEGLRGGLAVIAGENVRLPRWCIREIEAARRPPRTATGSPGG